MGESDDLATRQPARSAKMQAMLDAYLAKVAAQTPVPNAGYNPAQDPALDRRRGGGEDD